MDRHNAEWITREDDHILEFLREKGRARPGLISAEAFLSVSPGHVRERLLVMEYAGLVARTGLSSWEITESGSRYLAGTLDVRHQPRPTVERALL